MNSMSQVIEILSRNKKTAIIALITAIIVAIVILAVQALSKPKEEES